MYIRDLILLTEINSHLLDFDARGVTITDNGKQRGRIDDPAFARALLRVWLGDNPAQSSLKKALLGTP